jgi:hypothetical protein
MAIKLINFNLTTLINICPKLRRKMMFSRICEFNIAKREYETEVQYGERQRPAIDEAGPLHQWQVADAPRTAPLFRILCSVVDEERFER